MSLFYRLLGLCDINFPISHCDMISIPHIALRDITISISQYRYRYMDIALAISRYRKIFLIVPAIYFWYRSDIEMSQHCTTLPPPRETASKVKSDDLLFQLSSVDCLQKLLCKLRRDRYSHAASSHATRKEVLAKTHRNNESRNQLNECRMINNINSQYHPGSPTHAPERRVEYIITLE